MEHLKLYNVHVLKSKCVWYGILLKQHWSSFWCIVFFVQDVCLSILQCYLWRAQMILWWRKNLQKVTIQRDVVGTIWVKPCKLNVGERRFVHSKGIGEELCIDVMMPHGQTMQTKYGWEKPFLFKGKIRSLYLTHQPLSNPYGCLQWICYSNRTNEDNIVCRMQCLLGVCGFN